MKCMRPQNRSRKFCVCYNHRIKLELIIKINHCCNGNEKRYLKWNENAQDCKCNKIEWWRCDVIFNPFLYSKINEKVYQNAHNNWINVQTKMREKKSFIEFVLSKMIDLCIRREEIRRVKSESVLHKKEILTFNEIEMKKLNLEMFMYVCV